MYDYTHEYEYIFIYMFISVYYSTSMCHTLKKIWNIPGSVTKLVLSHEENVKPLQSTEVPHGPCSQAKCISINNSKQKRKNQIPEIIILNDSCVRKGENQNKIISSFVKKYTTRVSK